MSEPWTGTRDVILQVGDLTKATAFYERMMGLAPFERTESLVGFDAGRFRLFLEPGPRPGAVHEMSVDDVEAALKAVIEAGGAIVEIDDRIPRTYVRDANGFVFNLAKRS